MPITWPDEVDEIMAGDLAAALAYATPAKGTVITPMAPLGLRDREAGTITLTTSLGLWKKLDRMRANPNVAVAYHARDHGDSKRPEFVLAQGTASFSTVPDRDWLDSIRPQWDHFLGPRKGGIVGRWLDVYYYQRVAVTIDLRRIVIWPDSTCSGEPTVIGEPLGEPASPQKPPKNGTGPRVDTEKLAKQSRRLPHTLLGWICRDGLPFVVAAGVREVGDGGVELSVPPRVVPPGGRRAGLTAHEFQPRMVGQEQRIHTGWLEADGDRVLYAPHTAAGYRLPASRLLFTLAGGAGTRAGIGKARKAGLA
jgi:hypothetical protein